FVRTSLLAIQKDLVLLMGELATLKEDLPKYLKDRFSVVTANMTAKLEALVKKIEAEKISYMGWATPGATMHSAALDLARTTCRRAERRVCALLEKGEIQNAELLIYLNRLSDLLWLFARWVEEKKSTPKRKEVKAQ